MAEKCFCHIRDKKTGECYTVKDATARKSIEELQDSVNETQENVEKLQESVDGIDVSGIGKWNGVTLNRNYNSCKHDYVKIPYMLQDELNTAYLATASVSPIDANSLVKRDEDGLMYTGIPPAHLDVWDEKIVPNIGWVENLLDYKVTKETGKGLSTNDYTTEEKTKLAELSNYDDSELSNKITQLENNKLDKTAGGNIMSEVNKNSFEIANLSVKVDEKLPLSGGVMSGGIRRGNNLLNFQKAHITYVSNGTIDIDKEAKTITMTASANDQYNDFFHEISLKPNTTYTFSFVTSPSNAAIGCYIWLLGNGGNYNGGHTVVFTTDNTGMIRIRLDNDVAGATTVFSKFMLNEGSTALPYEDYYGDVLYDKDLLEKMYPIGTVYTSTKKITPAIKFGGVWEMLPEGYALWTTQSEITNENTIVEANASNASVSRMTKSALPNIHSRSTAFNQLCVWTGGSEVQYVGAIHTQSSGGYSPTSGSYGRFITLDFDASHLSTVFKDNVNSVFPPAYKVYAWVRVE